MLGMTVEPESADEARLRELGVADVADAGQLHELAPLVADLADDEPETVKSEPWHARDDGAGVDEPASTGRVDRGLGPCRGSWSVHGRGRACCGGS